MYVDITTKQERSLTNYGVSNNDKKHGKNTFKPAQLKSIKYVYVSHT